MHKKVVIVMVILLMVFILIGCEEKALEDNLDSTESTNTTQTDPSSSGNSNLEGIYVYEKFEGDLPFIINSHIVTLNSDKTYNITHVWDSKESKQTVTGDNDGTWAVVDGELVLTNDSNVDTIFQIEQDRIIETMYFGFGDNAYPVQIYF